MIAQKMHFKKSSPLPDVNAANGSPFSETHALCQWYEPQPQTGSFLTQGAMYPTNWAPESIRRLPAPTISPGFGGYIGDAGSVKDAR